MRNVASLSRLKEVGYNSESSMRMNLALGAIFEGLTGNITHTYTHISINLN